MTQPGVGPNTALAFVLTIGDVSRFQRGKQVASYLGLIPREESSGGRQKLGAISKQGNRMLRSLLVEAAQVAVQHDPGLRKQYLHRCRQKAKGVAKVATARKLAVRRYWMLRSQVGYPEIVRIESSSGAGPGRRKLDRRIDWGALASRMGGAKVENKKPFPTFPPPRLRPRRDVRIEESWSMFRPNRWLVERSSLRGLLRKITTASDWREISRVLVLNLSGQQNGAHNTDRKSLSLT
jgi:hypothetical protein